jgi:hypothetical protein
MCSTVASRFVQRTAEPKYVDKSMQRNAYKEQLAKKKEPRVRKRYSKVR